MKIDLTDRVALVTGSAHRVGKAIALELARQGVHILVHYGGTDENTVRETVQEIKSLGVSAQAQQADLRDPETIAALFTTVQEVFGRLDILVNSASVFHANSLEAMDLADWQESLDVNLTAPMLLTHHAIPLMEANDPPGGSIINILDYGSVQPWLNRVDHGISKAGLLMLTKISAVSLGKRNIRVNGVLPGPVLRTPGLSDELWEKVGSRTPLGRPGEAEDVARAVAYLAGESFITGTVLAVSGGEHLITVD
jgi:NAD(P)-dependent dehydrogenase (short-subunit alcohol dehydrogenase family)